MTTWTTRTMRVARWGLLASLLIADAAWAFELPPRDRFDATVERPLFFPGRRAGPPPDTAPLIENAAPPVSAPAARPRLIGVAVDATGRSVAVWRSETAGSERRVIVGDSLDGWRVEGIGRAGVDLSRAGARVSVPVASALPVTPD